MPSKRTLYRALSSECTRNARQFLADARRLKRARSRGHATSLTVLSIEESAKALIYHSAAEGVFRVVRKKPNHITTFTEKELLDHRFKHAYLANLFADWLTYAPFYEASETLRKPSLKKEEVRELILKAVHAHRILQVDLASGGRTAKEVQNLFALLEKLNALKNLGFYVDHSNGRVLSPNNVRTKDLERLLELAEGSLAMMTEVSRRGYTDNEKRLQMLSNQELLVRIRRARKRAVTRRPPTTPDSS